MEDNPILMNRAPVLTLWAAVVAERLGYEADTALTFGKCVAGLNAQSKGRMLGIFGPPKSRTQDGAPVKAGLGEEFWADLCDRAIPCRNTADGIRAVVKDKPIEPAKVAAYIRSKFGDDLETVRDAMAELANSYPPDELAAAAFGLYEAFRPKIPAGKRGWGAKGVLDPGVIRGLRRPTG